MKNNITRLEIDEFNTTIIKTIQHGLEHVDYANSHVIDFSLAMACFYLDRGLLNN